MKGSILKRGPRRYLIRIFLGRDSVTGKATRLGRTIHGTRREAEAALRAWVTDYESGRLVSSDKESLNEYLEYYKRVALRENVSDRTFEAYSYDLKRFVTDTIGRLPLSKIRRQDVQQLYIDLVDKGVGPTSVMRLHACLSGAFRQAADWRKIAHSPVTDITVPGQKKKVKRRPKKPMDPDQANRFLDAAAMTDWRALFELALASGMRPGEYLGLGWQDVDFENNQVRVTRAAISPEVGKPHLGPPKRDSRRNLDIDPSIMALLREHRRDQAREIMLAGDKWNRELNLVFPGANGEIMREQSLRNGAFRKVCKMAGLKGFSPYSLRHTCATLLLMLGEPARVVSERLGHASVAMTLDVYSHVLPTMQRSASDKLAKLLTGSRDETQSGSPVDQQPIPLFSRKEANEAL